jgi:hypothetical protein
LAPVPAVDAEIAVGRQKHRGCVRLTHTHEASVSKARGAIRVLVEDLEDGLDVVTEVERDQQGAAPKQTT